MKILGFCVALLPELVYLECHAVAKEHREAATIRHQGDIFRAQNLEEREKSEKEQKSRCANNNFQKKAGFQSFNF